MPAVSRRDEADLVRVDHRWGLVAQVELLEDAGGVRFRGRFADDELFADLGVGEVACEQLEDLLLARGRFLDGAWRLSPGCAGD
jgi:hypothetical protein